VLRDNDALARAFGVRMHYAVGERVWYYHTPRTHSAAGDIDLDPTSSTFGKALRTLFSKKLLDRWQGPYRVLAVGPCVFGDKPVQSGVLVLDMKEGPTRVTRQLLKLCRDPTDSSEGPPGTLPAGFARYLLAKHWHGRSPGSLTLDDVVPDSERHGVEAVLRHRLIAAARGRGRRLQYLVQWEGDVANSWEDALYLDACPTALREYWTTLSRTAELRDDFTIEGAGTDVVQQELSKVEKRRGIGGVLAVCGRGVYELAPGARAVLSVPNDEALTSAAVKGLQIMVVYKMTAEDGTACLQWHEGEVVGVVDAKRRQPRKHRVFWVSEGKYSLLSLSADMYGTEPASAEGTWFLCGSKAQVGAVEGIAAQ
jgi:hypothetical protein